MQHTFGTDVNEVFGGLVFERPTTANGTNDTPAPPRPPAGTVILVRDFGSANARTPPSCTSTAGGRWSYVTDDASPILQIEVSPDNGTTWIGPLTSRESLAAALTAGGDASDAKADAAAALQAAQAAIPLAQKGAPNGVATLGPDGKVPAAQGGGGSGATFLVPTTGDFSANLQATLDAARGKGSVTILPGSYTHMGDTIRLGQGDHLIAYGATITRTAPAPGTMFCNFTTDDQAGAGFPGYTGKGDIIVEGGTFDAAGNVYTSSGGNGFTFDHATNITVKNLTIKNISSWHAVEFNAVDGGKVLNCRFLGFKDNTSGQTNGSKEAIQIDVAASGSVDVPAYDGTQSRNITVEGCTCGPSETLGTHGTFVGTHTRKDSSTFYEGIRVVNNYITGTVATAIRGYGWRRPVISGNQIFSSGSIGISIDQSDRPTITGNSVTDTVGQGIRLTASTAGGIISGNHITRPTLDGVSVTTGGDRALIHDNHITDGQGYAIAISGSMKGVNVHDNIIVGCGLKGGVAGALRFSSGVQTSKIHDNTVMKSGAANETTTALSITSDCVGIWYDGNDFRGYGATAISDTSSTSIVGTNQTA